MLFNGNKITEFSFKFKDSENNNIKISLSEVRKYLFFLPVTLTNTGIASWPINTCLECQNNSIISFSSIILNNKKEIKPQQSIDKKIHINIPLNINPGEYCVVIKVILSNRRIIGDFFYTITIFDERLNDLKAFYQNQAFSQGKSRSLLLNKKLEVKENPIYQDNGQTNRKIQMLNQKNEAQNNREFRELNDLQKENDQKKDEAKFKIIKENQELLLELNKQKNNFEIKEKELCQQIKILLEEKNLLKQDLDAEKDKNINYEKQNLTLIWQKSEQQKENEKIVTELLGQIELLEQKNEKLEKILKEQEAKNEKTLNELQMKKMVVVQQNFHLKTEIENLKKMETNNLQKIEELQNILLQNNLASKLYPNISFSEIKDEEKKIQNNKDFNLNSIFHIEDSILVENENIPKKVFEMQKESFQLFSNESLNKYKKEQINIEIIQNANKKIHNNSNNKEKQINEKKALTEKEILTIFDYFQNKFNVNSLFKKEEMIKLIIDGNGDYDTIEELIFK